MNRPALYKVLNADGSVCNGGTGKWPLPRNGEPGEWHWVRGPLVPCENALHLCRREDLIYWLGPAIFAAESAGDEWLEEKSKVCVRRARLVHHIETWNERTARLFAADCAEHVLPNWERLYASDYRVRKTIETARLFARGEVDIYALRAAYLAALSAARSASAALSASAAYLAADSASAAYLAADSAAYLAADSASAAYWDLAARSASAALSAALSASAAYWDLAAYSAECRWQTDRLFDHLEGRAT